MKKKPGVAADMLETNAGGSGVADEGRRARHAS